MFSIITHLVLEVYSACFFLHASSPVGQYDPGLCVGKVARLSQASHYVSGDLGIFFMGRIFFPNNPSMCLS